MSIVLFGAGSSLIVEYEETCRRSGTTIVAAVRNRPGRIWLSEAVRVMDVEALPSAALETPCLCPLFTPAHRRTAAGEALDAGFTFAPALVDPTAIVARSTTFGIGSFVNAGCVVGAASCIADHVVINRGVSIGHHVSIAEFVSIGPSVVICGHAEIAPGALIGAGAVVLPGVRIGAGAIVRAGTVVSRDVVSG